MTSSPSLEEFIRYAESYQPFPWEVSEDEFQASDIKGKHSVLVSLIRFWKVVSMVREECPDFRSIVDVGAYPGAMIKILRHFFPTNFGYWAIGLGLSDDYRTAMANLGGRCFETELDPAFANARPVHEWPVQDADCVLLLDVIEHLTDPISCLDAINRALRLGGKVIITTDNLTSFANTYQMLRRGRSPNIHPLRSSLFFRGEWRPHFREFSAGELEFFLDYTGFKVAQHAYFERKQGDHYQDKAGHITEHVRHKGPKGLVLRLILETAPHLRDHQIVVATKKAEYEEVALRRPRPTSSMAEWLRICAEAGV